MASPFWDKINLAIYDLFGQDFKAASDVFGDSARDLTGSDPFADALKSVEALSPDAQQGLGFDPIAPVDPYRLDPGAQISVQQQTSSPFNVIDFSPADLGNTRGYSSGTVGSPAGPPVSNAFPVNPASLKLIQGALRNVGLSNSSVDLMTQGAFPVGITYPITLSGNTLRIDRLPQGGAPTDALITINDPVNQNVNSALVPNDVRASQILGLYLNGLFIQFESCNNPVFIAKPGELFSIPFTKIFVTTFNSSGRWRIISGNKTSIQGFSDERVLRQNLHVWDGGGMLDNPMCHPVPFYAEAEATSQNIPNSGVAVGAFALSATQNDNDGARDALSNFDDGSFQSQQANNNVVGMVRNKGYKVYWISELVFNVTIGNTGATNLQFDLVKSVPTSAGALTSNQTRIYRYSYGLLSLTQARATVAVQFSVPKRIVLAGYDTYDPASGGIQVTGEKLFLVVKSNNNNVQIDGFISLSGYKMPMQMAYNPYPLDTYCFPSN